MPIDYEPLTDQQLQVLWEQWQPAAIELLALRARVARLEAALRKARLLVLREVREALSEPPGA